MHFLSIQNCQWSRQSLYLNIKACAYIFIICIRHITYFIHKMKCISSAIMLLCFEYTIHCVDSNTKSDKENNQNAFTIFNAKYI